MREQNRRRRRRVCVIKIQIGLMAANACRVNTRWPGTRVQFAQMCTDSGTEENIKHTHKYVRL